MRRRTYLGAVASGVLAGCTGGDGTTETATSPPPTTVRSTPTATRTPTETETAPETPTETATETQTATETRTRDVPRITRANLVWTGRGENPVYENAVGSAAPGPGVLIGIEALLPVEGGTASSGFLATIFDSNDSEVVTIVWRDSIDASGSETVRLQTAGTVDLSEESTGEFTASTLLTDPEHEEAKSEGRAFAFDLVEPLTGEVVELLDYSPKEITTGREFQPRLDLHNARNRASGIVSPMVYTDLDSGRTRRLGAEWQWIVPADGTVTHSFPTMGISEPGTYEFALPAGDVSWEVTVTGPGM